jgi:hypothetical protein
VFLFVYDLLYIIYSFIYFIYLLIYLFIYLFFYFHFILGAEVCDHLPACTDSEPVARRFKRYLFQQKVWTAKYFVLFFPGEDWSVFKSPYTMSQVSVCTP